MRNFYLWHEKWCDKRDEHLLVIVSFSDKKKCIWTVLNCKKLIYLQIKASSQSRNQTLRSLEYSLFLFLPGRHTCFYLFHLRSWRKYSKLCLTSSPKQNCHQARWSSEKRQATTEWKNTLGRTPWNLLCVFMWPVFSMYCLNNEYFLKVLTDVW